MNGAHQRRESKPCDECQAKAATDRSSATRRVQRRPAADGPAFRMHGCLVDGDATAEREAENVGSRVAGGVAPPEPAAVASAQPPPGLRGRLDAAATGGSPLELVVRQRLEQTLDEDLADVRVHADRLAHGLATELHADAFTYGSHIFFRDGAYDPANQRGRHLIGHEVAHVLQQRGGAPIVQRRGGEPTPPLDVAGLSVVSSAIREKLYPTGDNIVVTTLEAITGLGRVLRPPDSAGALELVRNSPDKLGLRNVYHTLYRTSLERDFLARGEESHFRRLLQTLRSTYTLVDLLKVYLLEYPTPESGRLRGWLMWLPVLRGGRHFGSNSILNALRVATPDELGTVRADEGLVRRLSAGMGPGDAYTAMKTLYPSRREEPFLLAAGRKMHAAGSHLGAVLDVLLDIPQSRRAAFWERFHPNARGLSYADIAIAGRVATGTEAQGQLTRLDAAVSQEDVAAIARTTDAIRNIRTTRSALLAQPASVRRDDALAGLGDIGAAFRIGRFGALPEPIIALLRRGHAQQAMTLARDLEVPLEPVAVEAIIRVEHFDENLATLRALPTAVARRRVWQQVEGIVRSRIHVARDAVSSLAESPVFGALALIQYTSRHNLSQTQFDQLTQFAAGDPYESTVALLQAAAADGSAMQVFHIVEGMSEAHRRRLIDEASPFWTRLTANERFAGGCLLETADTGRVPSRAMLDHVLQGTSGPGNNRLELVRVAIESMQDSDRERYRQAYYQLQEERHSRSDAMGDLLRLQRQLANYFEPQTRAQLLEDILDMRTLWDARTPAQRLRAASILYHRMRARTGSEGSSPGEAFTSSDEDLAAASIEFTRIYNRITVDGAVSEEELRALISMDAVFRQQYQQYTDDLSEIGQIGATIVAIAVSIVVVAGTGGTATPAVNALLIQMGASGVLTSLGRVGTRSLLEGQHFELGSEEASREALSGFVEGAAAPLTNILARGATNLIGFGGRELSRRAAQLTWRAAFEATDQTLIGATVEGAIDGFLGGVIGEATLRAADARAWRRGIYAWMAANGTAILRAGAIGAGTGAVTSAAIHGVTEGIGALRGARDAEGGRRAGGPDADGPRRPRFRPENYTSAQLEAMATHSGTVRIGGRDHTWRVVNDTLILCSDCSAFHERIRMLTHVVNPNEALYTRLRQLGDDALAAHFRMAGAADPRALDVELTQEFTGRLNDIQQEFPGFPDLFHADNLTLARHAESHVDPQVPGALMRSRYRRAEIAYDAARRRGYPGDRDFFIEHFMDGYVLQDGSWRSLGTSRVEPPLAADTTVQDVLGQLGESPWFRAYAHLLDALSIADDLHLRHSLSDMQLGGRRLSSVRHQLKTGYRAELDNVLAGHPSNPAARAALISDLRGAYPDLDLHGVIPDPDNLRAALHRRFLEHTGPLGPADRGSLFETFNRRVHMRGRADQHVGLTMSSLADVDVHIDSDRVADALVVLNAGTDPARVRIHEDKYYTGPLTEHAQRQIRDYARILNRDRAEFPQGFEIHLSGHGRLNVDVTEVVVNFPDPAALAANLDFVEDMIEDGVRFQVFDSSGRPHGIASEADLQLFQSRYGSSE